MEENNLTHNNSVECYSVVDVDSIDKQRVKGWRSEYKR